VARRIVQPFKQVFRSSRAHPGGTRGGHGLAPLRRARARRADRRSVARYRGWKQDYDSSIKLKPYPALGLQAAFDFTVSYEEGETRLTSRSISSCRDLAGALVETGAGTRACRGRSRRWSSRRA
jgi:hypothetical protein